MAIKELHNIMPIANIPSVMEHGILSHNLRRRLRIRSCSVAMNVIQDRRKKKTVMGGRSLHDYANLYFDVHNPMLSKVREYNDEICVLRISPEVLDLPEVVISDRNAAADFVSFYPYPDGLEKLDFDLIYARFWLHRDNPMREFRHKTIKCAEVLVPNRVEPQYILGAYVYNTRAKKSLKDEDFSGNINVKSELFFNQG